MERYRLSRSFCLDEFVRSHEAEQRGWDNTPDEDSIVALERLALTLIQPVRDALGVPMVPSSGYRSPKVNKAVGGKRNSAHTRGLAADMYAFEGVTPHQIARTAFELGLPFDSVIVYATFCHMQVVAAYCDAPRGSCYLATPKKQWTGRTTFAYVPYTPAVS